jgi:hypothetical protein
LFWSFKDHLKINKKDKEELKKMLKPFLYGTKNIERVEVLQSSFKNQKTLEEDLNYLDQIQKTETPENALANANSVLARHTKKKNSIKI